MILGGSLFVQPMSLFAYTRTRRRTAIVMLGAWMLALLVGIANACASGRPDSSHASGEREATMMLNVLSLVLGFFILAGLCSAMLPTTFGKACLVSLFNFIIWLVIGAVVVVALIATIGLQF